jgi:hypothetical protein
MLANNQSSSRNDILDTGTISTAKNQSSSREERSLPITEIEIGPSPSFENFFTDLDLPEDNELVLEYLTSIHHVISCYLQSPGWKQKVTMSLLNLSDSEHVTGFFSEIENAVEEFPDAIEDDESSCSDDSVDSVVLTKLRLYKNRP